MKCYSSNYLIRSVRDLLRRGNHAHRLNGLFHFIGYTSSRKSTFAVIWNIVQISFKKDLCSLLIGTILRSFFYVFLDKLRGNGRTKTLEMNGDKIKRC